jgi:hypothetical protein
MKKRLDAVMVLAAILAATGAAGLVLAARSDAPRARGEADAGAAARTDAAKTAAPAASPPAAGPTADKNFPVSQVKLPHATRTAQAPPDLNSAEPSGPRGGAAPATPSPGAAANAPANAAARSAIALMRETPEYLRAVVREAAPADARAAAWVMANRLTLSDDDAAVLVERLEKTLAPAAGAADAAAQADLARTLLWALLLRPQALPLDELAPFAAHEAAGVRRAALRALGLRDDPRAVAVLDRATREDADARNRQEASFYLTMRLAPPAPARPVPGRPLPERSREVLR